MRWLATLVIGVVFTGMTAPVSRSQEPSDLQERTALAERYFAITHREERLEKAFADELNARFKICADTPCLDAVDNAARIAAMAAARSATTRWIEYYATHLTSAQLQALLSFASSPDGEQITKVLDEGGDDVLGGGRADAVVLLQTFYDQFCPQHQGECAASPGLQHRPSETDAGLGGQASVGAPAAGLTCYAHSPAAYGWGKSESLDTAKRIALNECAIRTPRGQMCDITVCK